MSSLDIIRSRNIASKDAEYERRIRQQDEDFQQALREAFWRGEFPGAGPVFLTLPTREAA